MCELKFGHNKRVKYIKGLARGWPLLLEVFPFSRVVPEKWANYTLQINLRGVFGSVYDCCETEAKWNLRARDTEI